MKIIVSGAIGRCCVGGHAWIYMQYLAGLRDLGHDVYYLEDCGDGSWVYNWDTGETTTDLDYPAAYITDCLETLGLGSKWIYRAGERSMGLSVDEFAEICGETDLLIMHSVPITRWRPEYGRAARRTFIDVDPGFTQILLENGDEDLSSSLSQCERVFTIGQRFGERDCTAPLAGREWLKTRPPVHLPSWPVAEEGSSVNFTSVMQWRGFKDVTYAGEFFGQKDREFPNFVDLPQHTTQPLLIGVTGAPPESLSSYGWIAVAGDEPSRTPWSYRDFIRESRAEFGIAKHGYVKMRGGWFSDRSVCYLASGRPVLLQETGQSDWLPTGSGLITFRDKAEAVAGIDAINSDYAVHRAGARNLAEQYFATDIVLTPLLEEAMA